MNSQGLCYKGYGQNGARFPHNKGICEISGKTCVQEIGPKLILDRILNSPTDSAFANRLACSAIEAAKGIKGKDDPKLLEIEQAAKENPVAERVFLLIGGIIEQRCKCALFDK